MLQPRVLLTCDSLHIPLFACVPVLGVSLAALTTLVNQDQDEPGVQQVIREAQWISSAYLATIILLMTAAALLNKPISAPTKVLVNNRYLRMLPRLLLVIIIPCLPLALEAEDHNGTLAGLVSAVSMFEYLASWRRDGKVFEPKSSVASTEAEFQMKELDPAAPGTAVTSAAQTGRTSVDGASGHTGLHRL
jgi:hypothetical protein